MPDLPVGPSKVVSRFSATEALDTIDHERLFRRWSYRRSSAFDRARLVEALQQMPPQLLRLKGHCRIAGDTGGSLLQMVGPDWTLTPTEAIDGPEHDGILLVGVGTHDLPGSAGLDAILDQALASDDAPPIALAHDDCGPQPSAVLSFHA